MKNNLIFAHRICLTLGMAVLGSMMSPTIVAAQSQFPNAMVTTKEISRSADLEVSKLTQISTNHSPVPGSASTSATALVDGMEQSESKKASHGKKLQTTASQRVAQADIDIGRTTRGGSSYVGLAGNIGLNGGESSLGDGNFAVISKVGLSRTLSVRPAAVFGDTTSVLLPITYDFPFTATDDPFSDPLPIAPYVGVGAAVTTGDDSQIAFLLSGGIDLPLNQRFTATASVNAGFFDETDIGLLLGVGYNFR